MAKAFRDIDWENLTDAVPAVVTAFAIPFSSSIATGIGLGFITYVLTKSCAGQFKTIHPAMVAIAVAFAAKFLLT